MAWPCRVVDDAGDWLALYIPKGATYMCWDLSTGTRRLQPAHWRKDVLRLMYPGEPFSIWLFWNDDDERSFAAYYVNMEEPFRRTSIGVDTNDHTLDVVVNPTLEWRWKDADELQSRVEQGIYSASFAREIQREAERVIGRLERRESPFGDGWEQWTPDPAWEIPELHPAWRDEPPRLWDGRTSAYLDTSY